LAPDFVFVLVSAEVLRAIIEWLQDELRSQQSLSNFQARAHLEHVFRRHRARVGFRVHGRRVD
jgi:hypothetical protein